MHYFKTFILFLFLSVPLTGVANAQTHAPGSVEFRAECRKVNDSGCTDHWDEATNRNCVTSPPGWAVHVPSISTGSVQAHGIQLHCGHILTGDQITVDSAFGPQSLSQGICVRSHVESGSGGGSIGTVFFNVCRSTFTVVQLDAFN